MTTQWTISGSDLSGLTPGEALQEVLQDHRMTHIDLAARLGFQVERVSAMIAGKEPITQEIALQLAQILDRPARVFQPR